MESNAVLLGYVVLALTLSLYALLLIVLRGKMFKLPVYRPMLLNILLAWVPAAILGVGLMLVLALEAWPGIQAVTIVLGVIMWFLTFPNAPYLITELNFSHRREGESVPLYFDILQTLALTIAGIFAGEISLMFMHLMLVSITSPGYDSSGILIFTSSAWILIMVAIFAGAFAIYLGRNIRVNSWDVLHPWAFLRRLLEHLRRPGEARTALGYTIFYGIFLAIIHSAFFGIFQGVLNVSRLHS